jgi:hypothetical protein
MTNEERELAALNIIEQHFLGMLRAAGSVDMAPETFIGYALYCVARFVETNKLPISGENISVAFEQALVALKEPKLPTPPKSLIITE